MMRLLLLSLLISSSCVQVSVLGEEYIYDDDYDGEAHSEYYDEESPNYTSEDSSEVSIHFKNISSQSVTIDYSLCDGYFYTDEETDENCRQSILPPSIQEVFGAKVQDCCGFHGFFVWSDCEGEDANGNPVRIEAVPVCKEAGQDMDQELTYQPKTFQCPDGCTRETMESFSTGDPNITTREGGRAVLTDYGTEYNNFCLAYACADYAGVGWKASADVCHCPEESSPEDKSEESQNNNNKKNPVKSKRPEEEKAAASVKKGSKQEKSQTENDIKPVESVKSEKPVAETRNAPEPKSQHPPRDNGANGVSLLSMSVILVSAAITLCQIINHRV